MRGSFGSGGGAYGYAGRYGVEGELWLVDAVGIGVLGARLGQTPKVEGDDMGAWVIAPTLSLRLRSSIGYLMLGVAGGLGRQTIMHRDAAPSQTNGFYGGAMLGYMFQPGSLEVGPLVRAEATGETWQVTLGVAVGFSL